MNDTDKGWCRVSLMGHKTYCGLVTTDGGLEKIAIYAEPPQQACPVCNGTRTVTADGPGGSNICTNCDDGNVTIRPLSVRWFGAAAVYEIEQISETEATAFVRRQIEERERMERWRQQRAEEAERLALEYGDEDEIDDVEEVD